MGSEKMEISQKKVEGSKCPMGRVSFPAVFEPKSFKGQPAKYSLVLIWPEDTDLKELKRAAHNAAVEKHGKDKTKWPKKFKMPFRSGDEEREGQPEYAGSIFITASSKERPQVVDAKLQPITKEDQSFYAGCYARASLIAFCYDQMGNQGVSFALQNVQKLKDGEKLSGRRNAVDEFEEFEDEDGGDDESNYSKKDDDEDYDDIS